MLLLFVHIAIDGVGSHCHFVHALGRVGRVKVIVGLALLSLGGLRGEHDVLLTNLHGLGGTFAVGGLLRGFDNVAACSLNGLLVGFGRERQAAAWCTLAVVGVEAWVARWSGEAGNPFLVGEGLAVLARAHDVLRNIDQVTLPVFFHRCAQLLGSAPMRLRLFRLSYLPLLDVSCLAAPDIGRYDGAVVWLAQLIVQRAVLHRYKV